MAREKRLSLFIVVTDRNGSSFSYHEDGYTAQEAVDSVRCYMDSEEQIMYVYKQVENWK